MTFYLFIISYFLFRGGNKLPYNLNIKQKQFLFLSFMFYYFRISSFVRKIIDNLK